MKQNKTFILGKEDQDKLSLLMPRYGHDGYSENLNLSSVQKRGGEKKYKNEC